MELPGVNPLGSMFAVAAESPMRKLQQITRATGSDPSGNAANDSRRHPEQENSAAEARDIAALRREVRRSGLPAGPPPAFEITLLEAEAGLEQALARIEAARTQERDGPALRLVAVDQPPDADESTSANTSAGPASGTAPAASDNTAS